MYRPKSRDPFCRRDLGRGFHCDWAVVVEKSELKMLGDSRRGFVAGLDTD
jgi:hypothetical protein